MMKEDIRDRVESLCREVQDPDDFINFLEFCVAELNKNRPVQAIQSAWLEITGRT